MAGLRVAAGHRLGPYELGERLGAGGMAEVYVARRAGPRGFNKRFAVKRILPQLARDPRFVAMFCDEARISAALAHPNIVQIVDFGEHDGELFMAMEYVDGVSCAKLLRSVAARGQSFPLGAALFIAHETLCALSFAHQASDETGRPLGIVHRDVSPGNILIGRSGEVKLADFGIVRSAFIDRRTNPGELKGKLGYMSPEQVIGGEVDARSDIFAAGIVLSEMLLARPLFPGRNELDILTRIYEADLRVLDRHADGVHPDAVAVLRRALARDPQDRFQSAEAFAEALRRIARAEKLALDDTELVPWLSGLGILASQSGLREATLSGLSDLSLGPRPLVSVGTPPPRAPFVAPPLDARPASRLPEAEAPELHLLSQGSVVGPLSLSRVLELIATGRVEPTALASEDGVLFQPLREIEQLAPLVMRPAFHFGRPPRHGLSWEQPLDRRTLPGVLLGLMRKGASGLLVAKQGRREKRVYFQSGRPCFVSSTDRRELIGARLVAQGLIGESDVERALALGCARASRRIGEVLVQYGALKPTELLRAVVDQLELRFAELLSWTEGMLAFHPSEQPGEEAVGLPRPPSVLIADAVRAHYGASELASLFRSLAGRPIARGPLPPVELGLPGPEERALERAPGSSSIEALVAHLEKRGTSRAADVHRALLLGLSAGMLVMPGWPMPG